MNFLTLTGEATNPTASNPIMTIVMFAIIIVVFYFFMIRPQKKRQKEEEKMRNSLQIGDEVTSIGGIVGRVVSIKDDSIILESPADHSKIKLLRAAIQTNNTVHDEEAKVNGKAQKNNK